jgi:hypothetical protein
MTGLNRGTTVPLQILTIIISFRAELLMFSVTDVPKLTKPPAIRRQSNAAADGLETFLPTGLITAVANAYGRAFAALASSG